MTTPENPNTAITVRERESSAIVPQSFAEAEAFAKAISESAIIPAGLRKRAPDVLVMVLAGRELGIAPLASLRTFHVIEGAPRLSADGLAAVVAREPVCEYLRQVEYQDERVTWETKRRGDPPIRRTWTKEDAVRARLWGKAGPWTMYPKRMLSARAKSELCRDTYPEIAAGLVTIEELEGVEEAAPAPAFTAPEPPPAGKAKSRAKAPAATAPSMPGVSSPPVASSATESPPPADDVIDAEIVDDATALGVQLGATDGRAVKDASDPTSVSSSSPPSSANGAAPPASEPVPSSTSVPSSAPPSSAPAADDGGGFGDDAPELTMPNFLKAVAAATTMEGPDGLNSLKAGRWLAWAKAGQPGAPHAAEMRAAWSKRRTEIEGTGGGAK